MQAVLSLLESGSELRVRCAVLSLAWSEQRGRVRGRVRGRARGRVKGRARGRARGRVRGRARGRVRAEVQGRVRVRVRVRVVRLTAPAVLFGARHELFDHLVGDVVPQLTMAIDHYEHRSVWVTRERVADASGVLIDLVLVGVDAMAGVGADQLGGQHGDLVHLLTQGGSELRRGSFAMPTSLA